MYFQQLNFAPHFLCVFGQRWRFLQTFSVFGPTNTSKIIYLTESTLPNNESTWNMVHFWCTSNNWTFCIISLVFLKVMKVSMEIFSFGARMSPKHKSGRSILPNNKISLEEVHFWCISNDWVVCLLFKQFWKLIKAVIDISAIERGYGSQNSYHAIL